MAVRQHTRRPRHDFQVQTGKSLIVSRRNAPADEAGPRVVVPLSVVLVQLRSIPPRADIAAERDIRVTAIYYTDLKESAEGSSYIRDSLDYPPRRE